MESVRIPEAVTMLHGPSVYIQTTRRDLSNVYLVVKIGFLLKIIEQQFPTWGLQSYCEKRNLRGARKQAVMVALSPPHFHVHPAPTPRERAAKSR